MAKKIRYHDRNPEPVLPPEERKKTFREYELGFSVNQALDEANRCLLCKDADRRCIAGCPVGVRIPDFIKKIREGDLLGAYEIITQNDIFPSICGRVCPQERQCEGACILYYDTVRKRKNKGLPVAIGALEKFVGDFVRLSGIEVKVEKEPPTGKKVAVVGSGPAGLSCAYELAKRGHEVHVYEALPKAGGVMYYGIPPARLDKSIVEWEVERLKKLGIKFFHGYLIGRTLKLSELRRRYDAVFLGVGAGRGKLGLPGDHLKGVYAAVDFLMRVNLFKGAPVELGKRTVVVGGGFTAVDCAITANRLGVETVVVYRRTIDTSSARRREWEHLQEEGVKIYWLTQPVEIIGNDEGRVVGLKCVKMKLVESPDGGRPKPVPVENSEHVVECDSVILAIGQRPNPVAYENEGIRTTEWGTVEVNENFETSLEGVFAGGDAVNGGDRVVVALAHGRKAAEAIHAYLTRRP